MRISCHVAPAQALWKQRDAYAPLLADCSDTCGHEDLPLAELVNPAVITDIGRVRPIAFDFHDRYDIGTVGPRMADQLCAYKRFSIPALQQLVGRALVELRDRCDLTYQRPTTRAVRW